MTFRVRTIGSAAALLGLLVGLIIVRAISAPAKEPIERTAASRLLGVGALPEGPLPGGRQVSLAEAEELVPYHLYRPDDSLASDSLISVVWYSHEAHGGEGSETDVVAIEYSTGVMLFVAPSQMTDAADRFRKMAIEMAPAFESTINGAPALVIPPNSDENKDGPAAAEVAMDGLLVDLAGDVSLDEIQRIAQSVK